MFLAKVKKSHKSQSALLVPGPQGTKAANKEFPAKTGKAIKIKKIATKMIFNNLNL